mmetsp:Transcript_107099/g.333840  ORF Transcript_107099/g.333840 Transcript_107099/m.333840 type:complete len:357 (-) Transcript_107099:581-1651(-)
MQERGFRPSLSRWRPPPLIRASRTHMPTGWALMRAGRPPTPPPQPRSLGAHGVCALRWPLTGRLRTDANDAEAEKHAGSQQRAANERPHVEPDDGDDKEASGAPNAAREEADDAVHEAREEVVNVAAAREEVETLAGDLGGRGDRPEAAPDGHPAEEEPDEADDPHLRFVRVMQLLDHARLVDLLRQDCLPSACLAAPRPGDRLLLCLASAAHPGHHGRPRAVAPAEGDPHAAQHGLGASHEVVALDRDGVLGDDHGAEPRLLIGCGGLGAGCEAALEGRERHRRIGCEPCDEVLVQREGPLRVAGEHAGRILRGQAHLNVGGRRGVAAGRVNVGAALGDVGKGPGELGSDVNVAR